MAMQPNGDYARHWVCQINFLVSFGCFQHFIVKLFSSVLMGIGSSAHI